MSSTCGCPNRRPSASRGTWPATARGTGGAPRDDDDWYAPHRLWHQVEPLLDGSADVTGLETACFYNPVERRGWACSPDLHRRLFVQDVHGGTLVYWRRVWERLARYPAVSIGEDALFLKAACRSGARVVKRPNAGCFVYVRHGANVWRFEPGSRGGPEHWRAVDPDTVIPPEDRPFYARLAAQTSCDRLTAGSSLSGTPSAPAARLLTPADVPARRPAIAGSARPRVGTSARTGPAVVERAGTHEPLVTCIMPTYNRRAFVGQSVTYFLRQDYPNRELLILDDGEDAVADLVPTDARVRYVRLDRRLILGAKRNLACELARGSVIVHWDDDDWTAPNRVRTQVAVLLDSGADVCGVSRLLYYEADRDRAWLYACPQAGRRWVAGNTLAYLKRSWQEHPFPEVTVGEDLRFIWGPHGWRVEAVPDHRICVGLVHGANIAPKARSGPYWHPHPVDEVHRLLGPDLAFYQASRRLQLEVLT